MFFFFFSILYNLNTKINVVFVENQRILLGYSLVYSLAFLYNIFLPFLYFIYFLFMSP